MCGLSLVAGSGGYPPAMVPSLLTVVAYPVAEHRPQVCTSCSGCSSWAPEHRLSSGGPWAQAFHGAWDLPGTGIKPESSHCEGDS